MALRCLCVAAGYAFLPGGQEYLEGWVRQGLVIRDEAAGMVTATLQCLEEARATTGASASIQRLLQVPLASSASRGVSPLRNVVQGKDSGAKEVLAKLSTRSPGATKRLALTFACQRSIP